MGSARPPSPRRSFSRRSVSPSSEYTEPSSNRRSRMATSSARTRTRQPGPSPRGLLQPMERSPRSQPDSRKNPFVDDIADHGLIFTTHIAAAYNGKTDVRPRRITARESGNPQRTGRAREGFLRRPSTPTGFGTGNFFCVFSRTHAAPSISCHVPRRRISSSLGASG